MRRHPSRIRAAVCVVAACLLGAIPATARPAAGPRPPPFELRKFDDAKTRASLPFPFDPAAPKCALGFPQVVGPGFDPAVVDEIATSQSGSVVAWMTVISEAGLPGSARDIVIFRQAFGKRDRVTDAAGDNDQPSISSDRYGFRMAWRGSGGARGATVGNIFLRSHTNKDPPKPPADGTGTGTGTGTGAATDPATGGPPFEDVKTVQVTSLVLESTDPKVLVGTAYDPALCSHVRIRDAGSGVKVRERDARIAFVSTARLDKSADEISDPETGDPVAIPQLFVWREQADRFQQITQIRASGFEVNRPSITEWGGRIAFECNANLTPRAVDPKDPTRVGNAGRVRQIYVWDEGRGTRQITWSDRDCLAPRFARGGRDLVFCSSGEPISGANPERNFEIFGWSDLRDDARALRQLTRTLVGDSVLPRPAVRTSEFAFWSTAPAPTRSSLFGDGLAAQCGPRPYAYRRGRVVPLGGLSDGDNLDRVSPDSPIGEPRKPDPATFTANPIVCGPPCPRRAGTSYVFVTNDPVLNLKNADDDLDGVDGGPKGKDGKRPPDDRKVDASLLIFHVARATRR